VRLAGAAARGATAYLNLESGDCHGDCQAVGHLIRGGVARVVIGLRHPLRHLRGAAARELQSHGVLVDVVGETLSAADAAAERAALDSCLLVNEVGPLAF
jgi:diaminohydroxyphosphoribosylaminopyrimidine deaminase / 5-amino-6-(5-phosphoribosylamino)uracil reductase